MVGIYKITNQVNQKVYVGQSNDIERRWFEHKRPCNLINPTKKIYIAFNEFGIENFSFEVIEECEEEKLNEREWYWIKYYDSLNNGYNMSTIENLQKRFSSKEVYEIQKELIVSMETNTALAKKYGVSHTWITLVNQGKLWYNKEFIYPLRMTPKPKVSEKVKEEIKQKIKKSNSHKYVAKKIELGHCIDCGKEISYNAVRCVECHKLAARTVERPDRETLKKLIRTQPFTTIAATYGVSDNAVRKWCKFENLPFKKREINNYSDVEWSSI